MDLSTLLLICAVATGVGAALAARYRSVGTQLRDLGIGFLVALLTVVLLTVVLILVVGLDFFGLVHFLYLVAVVGFPVAVAIIALPHYFDREYRTPLVAHMLMLAAAGLIAVGLWGTHVEPFRLQVDRQALGATGASRPIIVGVLSDLQTRSIGDHERNAVAKILEAEPDIVVLPGDLYQFDADEFGARAPEFVGLLRQITAAVEHVVLVEGNTDDSEGVKSIAEDAGAIFLRDELIDLDLGDQTITIIGLRTAIDGDGRQIDDALVEQVEASYDESDLVLLLSHKPDVILDIDADLPIDLTIAGHTHGGQVAIPGVGPIVTFSDVPRIVAAGGLHLVNGHPLYVSTGVGLERGQAPQLRFGVPPSVGVITIVPT